MKLKTTLYCSVLAHNFFISSLLSFKKSDDVKESVHNNDVGTPSLPLLGILRFAAILFLQALLVMVSLWSQLLCGFPDISAQKTMKNSWKII